MTSENTNNTATDFDSNPPIAVCSYDESIRLFCAAYEPLFVMSYSALRSVLPENADLLIVGAGTGMEICEFGRRSLGWKMTGVDPSADMLSIARERIAENGMEERASLFRGFTHELSDDLYDAATCILVMHFLADDGSKLSLLNDISKRLKPGAPLILVDGFGDPSSVEFASVLGAWKAFAQAMGVGSQIVEDGFNNQILKKIQFVPEQRIMDLLDQAGFVNTTRFFTSFTYGGWMAFKR